MTEDQTRLCDWAACAEPATVGEDGWWHCPTHLAAHRREAAKTTDGLRRRPRVSSWRRDHTPALICLCGHSESHHRNDVKVRTCSMHACPCTGLIIQEALWREHRTIVEPLDRTKP